jgi:hypothetical protein
MSTPSHPDDPTILAADGYTGWSDDHGQPAPWPDDFFDPDNDWRPDTNPTPETTPREPPF